MFLSIEFVREPLIFLRSKAWDGHPKALNEDLFGAKIQFSTEINKLFIKNIAGGDYYLEINSPGKALKESSMNQKFRERFEMELTKAKDSLGKPKGK